MTAHLRVLLLAATSLAASALLAAPFPAFAKD